MRADGIPVSELFGPVWQGEGPYTGRVCHFLRLGLCNLGCSWCDTAYTWDRDRYDLDDELTVHDGEWIASRLDGVSLVILSGGEPLIHQTNTHLQVGVRGVGEVHVETNGTITPLPWMLSRVNHFTVSPKVADQGDPEHRRINPEALRMFAGLSREGRAVFKTVVRNEDDVYQVLRFYDTYRVPDHARWVMPEGVTRDRVLDVAGSIDDVVLKHGLNMTLRQHVLMYETERRR